MSSTATTMQSEELNNVIVTLDTEMLDLVSGGDSTVSSPVIGGT